MVCYGESMLENTAMTVRESSRIWYHTQAAALVRAARALRYTALEVESIRSTRVQHTASLSELTRHGWGEGTGPPAEASPQSLVRDYSSASPLLYS